ncbi:MULTISPECIES: ATP-binding cassette domain-containing protein [unclassified Anaerobiospirillum]|uniref:ATP-binding cassette domain-containing protein n=1 Tax=unclassified Anaerobiospirillum TaxID=2647410 RepID=UPI001FF10542|nr:MULTISPECIES: ATP-binding cassette domain-containing protein [unclassified Anaerobiospirillum]MCK0525456.1 ATP-binding cassette domain-containing protein [Anaerobiospirillum sp. NML120449]MCK0534128.1 ATP-binding cassette domain-containing protein [Anaerobiospirillum sp. NML120511]MCK0539328.1 ATP-binding cassette domain-containing protein [Anaerobiospirillum sp. NML02-A-032]
MLDIKGDARKESAGDVLIDVQDVHFSYGGRKIYRGMSLTVPRGKITAILGPSGTGKTTLLRLIGGQLRPDSGTIHFDGIDVHKLVRSELYELRKRMSMLFQSGALFTDLNVFENVAFPLREHTRLPEVLIHDLVMMKLEAVGLRGAAYFSPNELSGGMARRAALARSIALDPDLIMYDEPFVGQDPITMAVLVKLIAELNASLGLTSIIVTHDVQEVLSIAHNVVIVADGRVIGSGTPDEVRNSSDPKVVQFINGDYDGPYAFNLKAEKDYLEDL